MDEIKIQTQNFDSSNIETPNPSADGQPKSKMGLMIAGVVVIIIIMVGVGYYFMVINKPAAPAINEQSANQAGTPTGLPQVVGPQTPPPGPSDELGDISADLNAIDLKALESNTASDTAIIGSAL